MAIACTSISIALLFAVGFTSGAKILGVMPIPSYSHQIVFEPLWKELSLKGHQVTVLTTNPQNNATLTNLTEIDISFAYEIWTPRFMNIVTDEESGMANLFNRLMALMHDIEIAILNSTDVSNLLQNAEFDLVIAEFSMMALLGFSKKFDCPLIVVTTLDSSNYGHYLAGNPTHPSVYADFALAFGTKMTFFQRFISLVFSQLSHVLGTEFMLGEVATAAHYFGHEGPHLVQIIESISMLFVNVNPVYFTTRPLGPATVLVGGGVHIKKEKPLPKDILEFLDTGSTIYFSLGTNVKAKDVSPQMLQTFLNTFAQLPYQVLWKYDKELNDVPSNVKIMKWIPQADVLRHGNVVLFITQGGLQSLEEAILFHVPVVGMPFYLDQEINVNTIVEKEIGVRVSPKEIDTESFTKVIFEVISNPVYKRNIEKLAKLALDQPMGGIEKAVWWTEYVLRHKGAKHLRRPISEELPLYQYLLLDVLLFVCAIFIILIVASVRVYRYFIPKSKPVPVISEKKSL